MSIKANVKATVVMNAKLSPLITEPPTKQCIECFGENVIYASSPVHNSQSTQSGVDSYAKAQVIAGTGESVSNDSFSSSLSGDNQSDNDNSNEFSTTTPPPELDISSPAGIAFTDEDSKNQFIVLQREGLNVLRSEIIATMEYIPIASLESNSNLNEQDNNSEYQEIKIRNITKIIELHRQIREYMLASAAKVYERTFSSYEKMTNTNIPNQGAVDNYSYVMVNYIEDAVKVFFEQGLFGPNLANTLVSLAGNVEEADSTMEAVVTTIIETVIEQNNSIKSLFSAADLNSGQANILFFRGLIEFFVYKFYIDIMIITYGSLEQIRDVAGIDWQIDVSGVRETDVADLMQPGQNQLGPMYFKSLLRFNDIADFYTNKFGTIKTADASDTSLLYQTLMFMYSQLGLRDSVKAFDRNINLPVNEKEFTGATLKIGHSNDLRDAFQQLTSLKIQDFISHLGSGTEYVRLGDFGPGPNLNKTMFRNIGSQMSQVSAVSNYRQTSEMLAAYAFDFCINLNSPRRIGLFGTGNNNSNFLFSSFGGLTYDQYRKQVLLGTFSATGEQQLGLNENSTNENMPTIQFFNKQNSGPLILGNQSGGQSHRDFYLANGVDIYESGFSSGNTLKPGAEYVFDNLLLPQTLESYSNSEGQIVDQDVKDNIENVFGGYKENSINFLKDLGSIFIDYSEANNFNGTLSKHVPIGKMSAKHRIKNLLTYLAEDFDRIIDTPNRSVPLLAIHLSLGGLSTSGDTFKKMQLYAFLANFWGFVDSSHFSELLGLEPASISEEKRLILSDLISGLAHFYNEELLQFFLQDRCDFNISSCLKDQGYHGGKYAVLQKAATAIAALSGGDTEDGFNPSGFEKSFQVFLTDDTSNVYPTYPGNKVRRLGNLSPGTESLPDEAGLGNKYNMKENLNRSFTRSATSLHDAYYDRDISDSSSRKPLGLFRLFRKSFSAAAADLDFSNYLGDDIDYTSLGLTVDPEDVQGMLKMFTFANPADNQLPRFSDSEANYKSSLGPLKLKMHHKAFVWYKWVFSLIRATGLQMSANATSANDGTFKILYNKSQLRGIRDGLLDAAEKIGSASQIVDLRNQIGDDTAYKRVKKATVGKIGELVALIESREQIAATTSSLITNHATSIVKTYEDNNIAITSLGPGFLTGLALAPLMSEVQINALSQAGAGSASSDIVAKWAAAGLTIINKKSIASITETGNKYFNFDNNKDLLVTNGLTSNINKIKFMYKILSSPGYGFLESEKKGLKTIMNVGVPASLVNIMQKNAFQETGNEKFLDSDIVCISIHKKNHLDVSSFYDPKHFVFDTSANILDINPVTKEVSSHLQNFSEESSLTNILSDIDITKINSFEYSGLSTSQNYTVAKAKDTALTRNDLGMKVLMNHAISYALKEYSKLTTGIDMSEDCFVMNLGRTDTSSNTSANLDQTKEELFQYVLETLNNSYPQVNDDPQLRNEVFRLTNIIKQMPPFSNKQNYIKTISPRKFDKVYSIFVNEKDFTLRDNPDIFAQLVNKNIGSEIEIDSVVSQTKLSDYIAASESNTDTGSNGSTSDSSQSQTDYEEVVEEGLGDIFINRDININKQINGYIRSLNENAPEVYNYSVSVALLPSDFLISKL